MLTGKVALVTGTASGIGAEIATQFAQRGALLCILDRNEKANRDTAARLRSAGAEVMDFACDVRDRSAIHQAVEQTLHAFGRVDIVVNNAGIYPRRRF